MTPSTSSRGPALTLALLAPLVACGDDGPLPCAHDAECTLPELCSAERVCAAPAPASEGAPCRHALHCASKLCVAQGTSGAACAVACDAPSGCAAGRICAPARATPSAPEPQQPRLMLLCAKPGGGERYLGEACTDDAGCRSGLCLEGRCATPCTTACPGGLDCEKATLTRDSLSLTHELCRVPPLLRTTELGAVTTPAAGDAELSFTLPPDPAPFVIVADDPDDLAVGIRRLSAPDGSKLIDLDDPTSAPIRGTTYVGTGTALVPGSDSPSAAIQGGGYRLLVATFDPKTLAKPVRVDGVVERVALVSRRRAGRGGLLDLQLHFSPGTGLKAAEPENPFVVETLARADALLRASLGVALGEVRRADLTAAEDEVADGAKARSICRSFSTEGPNRVSINIFMVKKLAFAAGFSGGIPGAPGLVQRPMSGIVLQKQSSAAVMGTLLAHELGHLLGLWHTTETTGKGDPISDTPLCPPATVEEQCPDYRNLMFPHFPTSDPLSLSAGQQQVARGSPWLYEVAYPEVCGEGVEAVDLATAGFASGSTMGEAASAPTLLGSCGGAGRTRVHLYRLRAAAKSLEVEARGFGFQPLVHLRRDLCSSASAELGCAAAATGASAQLKLSAPQPGAYFVLVDGVAGAAAGRYDLALRVTR